MMGMFSYCRELAYLDGYKDALIYVLNELREVEDGNDD